LQQTIVSVVLPVLPGQCPALQDRIEAMQRALEGEDKSFPVLKAALPTLHFMSIVIFDETAGVPPGAPAETPLMVLEANFDGAPGPFWASFEAPMGSSVRELLRLCAPPLGAPDPMFARITAPGSKAPLAPLLDRQSVFPAASHAGNRGLSQARIQKHAALFAAAEASLPPPAEVLAQGSMGIHAWLRAAMVPQFPWLDEPYEVPVTAADENHDFWALFLFGLAAVACALLPWLVLGRVLHARAATLLALAAAILSLNRLRDIGDLLTLAGRPPVPRLWVWLTRGLGVIALLPIFVPGSGLFGWLLLMATGIVASVLVLLAALRSRETEDLLKHPPADVTPDPVKVRALEAWEDCHLAGSDHMASLVTIKPGRFRAFLVRFGTSALALAVRYISTDGYLGSMRTIHFAHWAIVDGGRRLLFLSNFDGSWESYLDDFIEKAHAGLTLAWGNSIGFPPPRYLSLDGALQGRRFKNWARCSMTPSKFWYAAYPNLTVNQVVRMATIARGLCAPGLSPSDAATWVKAL
jgi:hypothetical protein